MLNGVGFKFQVQVDCRKEKSQSAKLDWSRIVEKEILYNFKSSSSPWKWLGFQSNLSTYKRETLAMFFKLLDLCYSLWDLRDFVLSNYTSIYWNKIYNQVVIEPSCYYKDQQLRVIWKLWVGSQSHKRGCLCCSKSKERRNSWIQSLHVVVSVSYCLR